MSTPERFRSLASAVERVSREWFAGILHPRATWTRGCRLKRKPKGIVCAHYDANENRIHVHPVFSSPEVPRWVLDWLIFHEMLHMVWGAPHSTELIAAESRNHRTKAAEKWLSSNLFRLAWKRGRA